jgi:hypothetical protein
VRQVLFFPHLNPLIGNSPKSQLAKIDRIWAKAHKAREAWERPNYCERRFRKLLLQEIVMKRNCWLLIFVGALLANSAVAQDKCSVRTTHARYGTTCQGFVSTGAGQPLAPYTLLGTCTGDAHGFFTCQGTQSFGGFVVPALDEGQGTVNTDCTGQITYNQGTPSELDINFLVLNDGKELRGMLQNSGSVVQCDLVRMGDTDQDR